MHEIRCGNLSLQELTDATISQLYKWRNDPSFLQLLTARPKAESLENFKSELRKDFACDRHLQYVVYCHNSPIGTIYSYSYNKFDKYCFISIFTEYEFRNSGNGMKAALIFSCFLFDQFNLYKIYFDIYDFNYQLISSLERRRISLEGRFLNQHLYNGKRHDVLRFAIYFSDIAKYTSQQMYCQNAG